MADWKKEIKLSDLIPKRKAKDPELEVDEAPKEKKPKTSFLKKDLSFKRKPKAERETRSDAEDEKPKKEKRKRAPRGAGRPKRAKKLGRSLGKSVGSIACSNHRVIAASLPQPTAAASQTCPSWILL